MRVWTLIELFRLTRAELFGLYGDIVNALAAMPDGDPERPIALANLQHIRTVLVIEGWAALARRNKRAQKVTALRPSSLGIVPIYLFGARDRRRGRGGDELARIEERPVSSLMRHG